MTFVGLYMSSSQLQHLLCLRTNAYQCPNFVEAHLLCVLHQSSIFYEYQPSSYSICKQAILHVPFDTGKRHQETLS